MQGHTQLLRHLLEDGSGTLEIISGDQILKCMSSEPFGHDGVEIKRGFGPSGLKFMLLVGNAASVVVRGCAV